MTAITDETRYRLLRYLEQHPQASHREVAEHLGVSVGKINYCIRALVDKGLLKIGNFRRSNRKMAYRYVLTAKGIEEKLNVTVSFLRNKVAEYDALREEVVELQNELEAMRAGRGR